MPLACKLENFKMWKFIDVNDGWKGRSVIISYHIQSHFYSSFLINLIIRAMKNSVQASSAKWYISNTGETPKYEKSNMENS